MDNQVDKVPRVQKEKWVREVSQVLKAIRYEKEEEILLFIIYYLIISFLWLLFVTALVDFALIIAP
jgi:hypothetical protein